MDTEKSMMMMAGMSHHPVILRRSHLGMDTPGTAMSMWRGEGVGAGGPKVEEMGEVVQSQQEEDKAVVKEEEVMSMEVTCKKEEGWRIKKLGKAEQ